MIGSGLKKYAKELGLDVQDGIAYGQYRNYTMTMLEGAGYKTVAIAAAISDASMMERLRLELTSQEFSRKYRLQRLNVTAEVIELVFLDQVGTMKRLRAGLEYVLDTLTSNGIPGADVCCRCKQPIMAGAGQLVKMGQYVYGMHNACIQSLEAESAQEYDERRENGSIVAGVAGAVIGGILGAIPWAVAYYFGWYVGWLGFLIGIAAKKGYEIMKGRETKAKAVVIVLVTILAVVLAEYGTCFITFAYELMRDPEIAALELSLGDIFYYLNVIIAEDSKLLMSMIFDVLLGWLFAFLGISSVLRSVSASNAKICLKRMKKI